MPRSEVCEISPWISKTVYGEKDL